MSTFKYLIISAFFGFLSILSDQFSYQIEKYIVEIELEFNKNREAWFEFIILNKTYSGLQRQIDDYSTYFHDEYNYGRDRKDFEIRESDVERLALLKNSVAIGLESSRQIATNYDASMPSEALEKFNLTPPNEENFYTELKELDFFAMYEIDEAIAKTYTNADTLNKSYLELLDNKSNLNYWRQISLLFSIGMSLLSLLCLFIFFRITIAKRN